MENHMNSIHTVLMYSLSTLPPPHLRRLTLAVSAFSRRHLRCLSAVLSSPIIFSLTVRRLQSLSLHHKSLIIARHLLSSLAVLRRYAGSGAVVDRIATSSPPCHMKVRDLDAVLLLLFLCEVQQHDRKLLDAPIGRWREILCGYLSNSILRMSYFAGCSSSHVLLQYVESIGRCWNLVDGIGDGCGREVPASAAAVVALPSVAASGGRECAICTDEMREGREVCELPCRHLFHWTCVLQWLRKRDTCPCCRRRLPPDHVRREIGRLLEDLPRVGGGGRLYREYCL